MRYLAGKINAVMAKLDKTVALVLKMYKGYFKNFCNKNSEYSGI